MRTLPLILLVTLTSSSFLHSIAHCTRLYTPRQITPIAYTIVSFQLIKPAWKHNFESTPLDMFQYFWKFWHAPVLLTQKFNKCGRETFSIASQVTLFFKTEMGNPSSDSTWHKMKCMSIERYQKTKVHLNCMLLCTLHLVFKQRLIPAAQVGISSTDAQHPMNHPVYTALLSTCKTWGEVFYGFHERRHVQQKRVLFMGGGPFYSFKKLSLKNR
jgi:hypothetical protein